MTDVFKVDPGETTALGRARLALEGLSLGDAFGERFFGAPDGVALRIERRMLPNGSWAWTDDTAMGMSVFEALHTHKRIDSNWLAQRFADRYVLDPYRGYGGTAHEILAAIARGEPWRTVARAAFDGQGSMGNGAAMRVAPVGGYFCDDLEAVMANALASAEVTHAHPDGVAGAIAVAVAAALASRMGDGVLPRSGDLLLREVLSVTPGGATRDGIETAAALRLTADIQTAVDALGNGSRVISSDTVPFSLWCAARHLEHFEEALWTTVSGLGDRDTTCAIVGGIVALSVGHAGLPRHFVEAREPLEWAPARRGRGGRI